MMEQVAPRLTEAAPSRLGARLVGTGVEFAVFSRHAEIIDVCVFDEMGEREIARWRLGARDEDIHHGFVPEIGPGARYGLRADGPYDRARGHCFDPAKLLVDPFARRIDRPFAWRPELAAPRAAGIDTAPFMPRAIIEQPTAPRRQCSSGGRPSLIYEIGVRAFTRMNPDVPGELRGTLEGLASPRVLDYLVKLGVSHVELMPIAACMSERHLVDKGLVNAWGYNPGTFMALDPALAPRGFEDLEITVAALRAAGIAVILDVVFNHTAEGDEDGPTLSLRGLDNATYYRHDRFRPGRLVNDTGCGNTVACDRAPVIRLIMETLREFVIGAGIDGFRFDLAATLARDDRGFPEPHPLLTEIAADPILKDRVLVAEPWDVGPGGYRLGAFPSNWMEWNDRFRDQARRFWRGDRGAIGDFATRLVGSADIFRRSRVGPFASVNFVAAHDGFTLRDTVSFARKHNEANGEDNRDGTDENFSWNNGVEGPCDAPEILTARQRDVRALLATLLLARGTPMLTAGDEFGRTQNGNNNAYAQDNATTWLDWAAADLELVDYTRGLAALRQRLAVLREDRFLEGAPVDGMPFPDVFWSKPDGSAPSDVDWRDGDCFCLTLAMVVGGTGALSRVFIAINRGQSPVSLVTPPARSGMAWVPALDSARGFVARNPAVSTTLRPNAIPARGIFVLEERSIVD